ncbi:death-associated protein 1 isoform X2 [Poecile atricapillus]|uniref:death-associated protein 1 isoform X2 n=1 Tax=Poecile atricapillus TaxID=48891 RepID=UPI002738FA1F|nr:death-associated protein 1 isoform X2 [Poecile atricapillus]
MSSPPKEKAETRAGHPPAVKAGGMRIVQKHPHNSDAKEEKDKDGQDRETSRCFEHQEPKPLTAEDWGGNVTDSHQHQGPATANAASSY